MTPATIFLAKLWGPILVIMAIGIFVNLKKLPKLMDDMEKSYALTYITGFFTLAIGMLLVSAHNMWNNIPAGIISVFAWGALIKGASFIIIPDYVFKFAKLMVKNSAVYMLAGIIMIAVGVYLGYAGYFM